MKLNTPTKSLLLTVLNKNLSSLAVLALPFAAAAQTEVFYQDFEVDHSLDNTYITNYSSGAHLAHLFFDYSSAGIPLSPHSTNSSTHALKMCANLDTANPVFGGVSVSPVGFGITENFDMHFDGWFNFNGPAPAGGSGSTQVGGAGYGTAGTTAQVAGVADSVFIGGTADGGSSADYRVYSPAHAISYQDGSFRIGSSGTDTTILGDPSSGYVYAGTNRNSANGYYSSSFPGQTPPAAQTALYAQQTGTAQNGSLGFKWHDVSLQKIANVITYKIDGILVATIDVTDAGTLGGTNILFNHYDINATASTDVNRTNLIFTLVDNVRITNFPNVVSVSTATPSIAEGNATAGTFAITRTSSGTPLTVNYTMTGLATNGVDYTNAAGSALSGSVTFAASATSTNINVFAVDDSIAEVTENIILNIDPSPNYTGAGNATIRIVDNEPSQLTITNLNTRLWERTNDFARFQITRLGSTNSPSFPINFSFTGGSATYGADFYTNTIVTFDPGMQSTNISIFAIEDGVFEGNEIAQVNIAPATSGEYTVGAGGSASVTIVDADVPPETVLFADNFNTDTSGSWITAFGSTNASDIDFSAIFNFDYSGQSIPAAPHSAGDTHGLFVTVNKDGTPAGAALNLYPVGQNFSGNYALRFDMWMNIIAPGQSTTTEYALFGVNHSGTKTNWWRSGGVPGGGPFDGIFYLVESDAQSTPNFQAYSSPTTNNNPTGLTAGINSSSFTSVFKSPPWAIGGSPASTTTNLAPWSEVEVSQIGNVMTLSINKAVILRHTNGTPYTSGNIMLGYEDAFDSVGNIQSYVVYDNVRVVSLASPTITAIRRNGGNIEIDFTAGTGDVPAQFALQSTSSVTGGYVDVSATITSLGGGNFRATRPFDPALGATFFRVRRAY